jgi:hypothetical protein
MTNTTISNTLNVIGIKFSSFLGGAWIDLPTSGPSGIGIGGSGTNPFLAYANTGGNWFSNSVTGDIAIRNLTGNILLGNTTGKSTVQINNDQLTVQSTGGSTSSTTGALLVSGGAGVAENIYSNGYLVASYFNFAIDTSTTSTGSATFLSKLTLTTPSLPAGTYYYQCSCIFTTNSSSKLYQCQFNVDTIQQELYQSLLSNTSLIDFVNYNDIITLTSGVHTINISFARNQAQTISCRNARIFMYRVV